MDAASPLDTIARLADEGLPVCAIARALKMPSDEVRELLQDALSEGVIVEYPREDWPPGCKRNSRGPKFDSFVEDNDRLQLSCARYFGTTKQQSAILAMLLKRSEATKVQLHQVIERDRPNAKDQTDIKLVDVLICILRRKLKPFGFAIKTMWGTGYLMEAKDRAKAVHELQEFVRVANDPAELVEAA